MLARNLERLGARAIMGLARTGSSASNGSGDYVLAFSTAAAVRRNPELSLASAQELGNDAMSALFQAVTEATEEALYNALLTATPVSSRGVAQCRFRWIQCAPCCVRAASVPRPLADHNAGRRCHRLRCHCRSESVTTNAPITRVAARGAR
jgi:hypothetical protein